MGQSNKHENVQLESSPIYDELVIEATGEQELAKIAFTLENYIVASRGNERPMRRVEDGLNEAIIGQTQAVRELVDVISRQRIRNPNRPNTMIFLGPTGVGKTETPVELANLLHQGGGGYLYLNAANYGYGHNVAQLVGAPPGYVGSDIEPLFASKELEKDYCVVCVDEIEKGGPELYKLLLQITDENGGAKIPLLNKGKDASFKKAILIFTSNLGTAEISKLFNQIGFAATDKPGATKEAIEKKALGAMATHFSPEFIGRIDSRIVFNQLNDQELGQVLERYVEKRNKDYRKTVGIDLKLSPEVRDAIVAGCDDRKIYNARPVLRAYDRLVETMLSDYINSGGIQENSYVYVALSDDDSLADAAIMDRLEMLHAPSAVPLKKESGKQKKEAKEQKELAARVRNGQMAIGLAAVAGVASLLFSDYMSRRVA